jgi:flavin reductase (DIM6/NTAB) family NADH-FMN oxidoreductase RutF
MIEKIQIQPRRPVYPTPVGLITSVDAKGRPNIIALGEVFNLSIIQPVRVGIRFVQPPIPMPCSRRKGSS